MDNPHSGHRERMRDRFIETDACGFHDHELLEMLLFYSIPRANTNDTAHRLLDACGGSIRGVFEAGINELAAIEGIGMRSAVQLRLVSELFRRVVKDEDRSTGFRLTKPEDTYAYLMHEYFCVDEERFLLLCFDNNMRFLRVLRHTNGSANTSAVDVQTMLRTVLSTPQVSTLVVAHNHPRGSAIPSPSDIEATNVIRSAFHHTHIRLYDHIIVGEDGCCSMGRFLDRLAVVEEELGAGTEAGEQILCCDPVGMVEWPMPPWPGRMQDPREDIPDTEHTEDRDTVAENRRK